MKVYFSSHFDSGYYLDYSKAENRALFNLKIVGPQGLLALLEQKTGQTGKYKSHASRKIEYMGYLKEYAFSNPDVFFSQAFGTDPAGVASELLRYRDQLVLAGWDKLPQNMSEKIDALMAIEKDFPISPGYEDRWANMLKVLERIAINPGISELLLFEDEIFLYPFYRNILERLRELGVRILNGFEHTANTSTNLGKLQQLISEGTEAAGKLTLDITDRNSLQLFAFQTDLDAAHFFAAQELSGHDHLVICENSLVFDSVASTMGRARPGTGKTRANTTTLQLFKLSSCLFAQPFNVLNYMAYLQCPLHPVSNTLRWKIMRQLSDTGGFSADKINEIIDTHDFLPDTDEGPEKQASNNKKRKEIRTFLIPVTADRESLPVSQILAFYHELENWAVKRCQLNTYGEKLNESELKQLMHVYSMAGLLGEVIRQSAGDFITTDQLMRCIRDIYVPIVVVSGFPEKGSTAMVSNPGQIISRPDVTVWLDFFNQEINPDWYDFLSEAELIKLEELGLHVWRKADQAAASLWAYKNAIERTKSKLCLAIPLKVGDKSTADHPLYSYLKSVVSNLDELLTPLSFPFSLSGEYGWEPICTKKVNQIVLPEKKVEHQIKQGALIPKRKKESSSSVELLVQSPFDWVMQYAMHIKSGNSFEMAEVETTLGNVAHAFIHDLFEVEEYNLQGIRQRLANDYASMIEQAVLKYGAILLLDENRFERQRLESKLKESLESLLNIISDNRLTIIKSEFEITSRLKQITVLSEQDFSGSLDLLLLDDQDRDVIFDLKWTYSSKKYEKKLREGKSIQLALYKELISEANTLGSKIASNVKSGYYLLGHSLLITSDEFVGNNVFRIDPALITHQEVVERINNSISYRREQFSNGIIEEGEEEPKENISYYRETEVAQLTPMELDSTNKNKKNNFYSKFKVFKG